MTKKEKFINYVNERMANDPNVIEQDVVDYWTAFCTTKDSEKPILTDNGKIVLKYLQDNLDRPMNKARDIAEGLFISSRTVSGSLRKLVSDGFVEKIGENPVVYSITDKGKNYKID